MQNRSFLLHSLKDAVESVSGRKILTMADARWLSSQMEQQKLFLSSYTIARFFGILKPERKIYEESLNLLAAFVGHKDWNSFFMKSDELLLNDKIREDKELDGWPKYTALEICIQNKNWPGLIGHLHGIDWTKEQCLPVSKILAETVRRFGAPSELMELMGSSPIGRKLYYEFSVDEDDDSGYFSLALEKYYRPDQEDHIKWFFRDSYLFSKIFYASSSFIPPPIITLNSSDLDKWHYHEQSRFLELKVIENYQMQNLEAGLVILINQAIDLLPSTPDEGKSWLFARIIKAAWHLNQGELLIECKKLLQKITELVTSPKFHIRHSGDLILQFFFCLYTASKKKPFGGFQPLKQKNMNFWDINARIALENGTLLCYQPKLKQSSFFKEFEMFCIAKSHNWILNGLSYRFQFD
jgi:hypothetical protein